MSTSPVVRDLSSTLRWSIGISVLLSIAGLVAILAPLVSGVAITLIVGWLVCLVGILHFLFAWRSHATSTVLWELLLGALYLFGGVYLIRHPIAGLASLTLFLVLYFVFKGLLEVVQYFQLQPRHGSGWLLVDGGVTLVLAVLIWRSWPSSSVWALGTLVGISLLFTGLSRLMISLAAQRQLTATTAR